LVCFLPFHPTKIDMKLKKVPTHPAFILLLLLILSVPGGFSGCKSESERLKEEIVDVNEENSRLKRELNALKTENANMHMRLAQLNLQISALHNEIQNLQKDLDALKTQIRGNFSKDRRT
jgi:septal ring factor EnvC (AmiA/AmiB activator)